MTTKQCFFLAAWTFAVCAAVSGCNPIVPGLTTRALIHDDQLRTYDLYVPGDAKSGAPMPLLIALHRLAESGEAMARMTGFNELAEREGFIVAYPDGLLRRFNFNEPDGPDDVGFLRAVVDDVSERHSVDPARVYVTGASNGGFLTYKAAIEASDVFAAAAAVVAPMPESVAALGPPPSPVPMLVMLGTADPIIPFDETDVFAGPGMQLAMLTSRETIETWADWNGLELAPEVELLPDTDPADGTITTRETYTGAGDGEAVLYIVDGGGHTWPGGRDAFPEALVGPIARDFSVSEAIWAFFERHRLAD